MGDTFIAEVLQPRFKTRPCLELCLHSQRGWFYRRPYTTVQTTTLFITWPSCEKGRPERDLYYWQTRWTDKSRSRINQPATLASRNDAMRQVSRMIREISRICNQILIERNGFNRVRKVIVVF